MPFDLMQILALARMQELLTEALLRAGCSDTGAGLSVPCGVGQTAVIDVENLKIRLEIAPPDDYGIWTEEEYMGRVTERVQQALEKGEQLDNHLGAQAEREVAAVMALELRDLALAARKVLNSAIKEAYREAIKEKAAQIGNVSAISESSDGNITRIRIEVSV